MLNRFRVKRFVSITAVIFIAACLSSSPVQSKESNKQNRKLVDKKALLQDTPNTVAILPFQLTYDYDLKAGDEPPKAHQEAVKVFREIFYQMFSTLPFHDAEILLSHFKKKGKRSELTVKKSKQKRNA